MLDDPPPVEDAWHTLWSVMIQAWSARNDWSQVFSSGSTLHCTLLGHASYKLVLLLSETVT